MGVVLSLRDFGAGGWRYDLRLCRSIMLIAHSCRSTGVRLAACRKASLSCYMVSDYPRSSHRSNQWTYVKLAWSWTFVGLLQQALANKVMQDRWESIALRQLGCSFVDDLLEQI